VGTQVTQVRRVGRDERTMTTELIDYGPPRSFAFRGIDGPVRAVGKSVIEPLEDGTRSRLTTELDFEGHGVGKLQVPLVRRRARKEMPRNHQHLKQLLERSPA
jgi:Polyketide cyclase / dehydrase and lipid transport